MENKPSVLRYIFVRIIFSLLVITGCILGFLFHIKVLQIAFGLILTGFLPGYFLIRSLFHRPNELFISEKISLAITFSLVISMTLALLLNLIPQGLNYWNILFSLGGIVFLFSILSIIRDWRASSLTEMTRLNKGSLYLLLIPILTLTIALLVLSFFKIDRSVDYVEFSIENTNISTARAG